MFTVSPKVIRWLSLQFSIGLESYKEKKKIKNGMIWSHMYGLFKFQIIGLGLTFLCFARACCMYVSYSHYHHYCQEWHTILKK